MIGKTRSADGQTLQTRHLQQDIDRRVGDSRIVNVQFMNSLRIGPNLQRLVVELLAAQHQTTSRNKRRFSFANELFDLDLTPLFQKTPHLVVIAGPKRKIQSLLRLLVGNLHHRAQSAELVKNLRLFPQYLLVLRF